MAGPTENQPNIDLFTEATQHARWELDLLWKVHATFLVPLTLLLGFSLQASVSSQTSPNARLLIVVALVLGLLMCVPWFVVGQRAQRSYEFRIAQARAAEPSNWNLIAGAGEKFAKGDDVTIAGMVYRNFGRNPPLSLFRSRHSSSALVGFVAAIYVACLILIQPFWPVILLSSPGPTIAPYAKYYPLPIPSAASYPLPVSSPTLYPLPVPSAYPYPLPDPSATGGKP